jgi:hypothetical protein
MREQMLGKLEIRFAGEEGLDAGGVLRDWYYQISHEIAGGFFGRFSSNCVLYFWVVHSCRLFLVGCF